MRTGLIKYFHIGDMKISSISDDKSFRSQSSRFLDRNRTLNIKDAIEVIKFENKDI